MVAELPHRRQQLPLDLRLLHLVLHIQTTHNRLCVEFAFLQLQFSGLRSLWPFDWYGGIFDGVCFYSEDIQVCPLSISIGNFDADFLIVLLRPIDQSENVHRYTLCTSTAHHTLLLFLSYFSILRNYRNARRM